MVWYEYPIKRVHFWEQGVYESTTFFATTFDTEVLFAHAQPDTAPNAASRRQRRRRKKLQIRSHLHLMMQTVVKRVRLTRYLLYYMIIYILSLKEPPRKAVLIWISSLYSGSWNSHFVLNHNSRVIYRPRYRQCLRGKIPAFSTILYVFFQGFYMKLFMFSFSCIVTCKFSTESIRT